MNTVSVHLNFLVNHAKLHGTSFVKQITGTLTNIYLYKLIIPPQSVIGNIFAYPLAKGFRKTSSIFIFTRSHTVHYSKF